jgi:K+-transporting ATPase ATPase A chain
VTANGAVQLLFYLVVLLALAKPLGAYMAQVYKGRPTGLARALGWLERLTYRAGGVSQGEEMGWKTYAIAMLLFNAAGLLVVYALQRLQGGLPFNPQPFGPVSADSSFPLRPCGSWSSGTSRGSSWAFSAGRGPMCSR